MYGLVMLSSALTDSPNKEPLPASLALWCHINLLGSRHINQYGQLTKYLGRTDAAFSPTPRCFQCGAGTPLSQRALMQGPVQDQHGQG